MATEAGIKPSTSGGKKAAAHGAKVANGVKHDLPEVAEAAVAPDARLQAEIEAMRTRLHETLGQAVLAMSTLPRYRDQTLGDLRALILEPLLRDRVLIATSPGNSEGSAAKGLAGIAIWASVSDEVDAKIREQVKARVFPIKLKAEDWTSGDKAWLFDVIAPSTHLASAVLKAFAQRVAKGELNIHPVAAKQVDAGLLKRNEASTEPTPA